MDAQNSIRGVRCGDRIDLFVIQDGLLYHYCSNQGTGYFPQFTLLWNDISSSEVAVVGYEDDIDVFFINKKGDLMHFFTNKKLSGRFMHKILFDSAMIGSNPFATKFKEGIDICCIDKQSSLWYLKPDTKNQNQYIQIRIRSTGNQISNLCGVRRNSQSFNICFLQNRKWYFNNRYIQDELVNSFSEAKTKNLYSKGKSIAVQDGAIMAIFTLDEMGFIIHIQFNLEYFQPFQQKGKICNGKCKPKHGTNFSVTSYENQIDLYYIGQDNYVYCCYYASRDKESYKQWRGPFAITSKDAVTGLESVRKNGHIDVFYFNFDKEMRNYFIGERANNDKICYHTKYKPKSEMQKRVWEREKEREKEKVIKNQLNKLQLSQKTVEILLQQEISRIEILMLATQKDLDRLGIPLGDVIRIRSLQKK